MSGPYRDPDDLDDLDDQPRCAICGGYGLPLGKLRDVMYCRCRQCGWIFEDKETT